MICPSHASAPWHRIQDHPNWKREGSACGPTSEVPSGRWNPIKTEREGGRSPAPFTAAPRSSSRGTAYGKPQPFPCLRTSPPRDGRDRPNDSFSIQENKLVDKKSIQKRLWFSHRRFCVSFLPTLWAVRSGKGPAFIFLRRPLPPFTGSLPRVLFLRGGPLARVAPQGMAAILPAHG